jgi:hypothetical protein
VSLELVPVGGRLRDAIMLTIDFESKVEFDMYWVHPYHAGYINQTAIDYLDVPSFTYGQFEF